MARESDFQGTIIKWLRQHGCIVLKYQQNATTRAAIPEAARRARAMVAKMDEMSWARIVYPENWAETKKELEEILK